MDFLKRELAPLSTEAWAEIEERAIDVLGSWCSARKVVSVVGPKGWSSNSVNEGRLRLLDQGEDVVKAGVYRVKPLVESRLEFELDRWEMDDITRGARDPDLEPLEECMKKMAVFEEKTIYYGHEKAGIDGLIPSAEQRTLPFGKGLEEIMHSLSTAVVLLKEAFQGGPFSLVVGEECWSRLYQECAGYPLPKRAESLIGGKIVLSPIVESALLIPHDHEDLELTIGGDFSIGYVSSDTKRVRLFATESFLFRVLDPTLIVPFSL